MSRILVFVAFVACGGSAVAPGVGEQEQPLLDDQRPPQPLFGPGGSDYPHADVRVTAVPGQLGGTAGPYWLYEPSQPTPASAPVVYFLPSHFNWTPAGYDLLLRHVARKGFTVVFGGYDDFRATSIDPSGTCWQTPNCQQAHLRQGDVAVATLRAALQRLSDPTAHVPPSDSRVLFTGHSSGGYFARWVANNRPVGWGRTPYQVPWTNAGYVGLEATSIEGTVTAVNHYLTVFYALEGYTVGAFTAETPYVEIVTEDMVHRNTLDLYLRDWSRHTHISCANKNFLILPADDQGSPAVYPIHESPGAMGPLDTDCTDFYGFWKPLVAVAQSVFVDPGAGVHVFGRTPEVLDMGAWKRGIVAVPMFPPVTAIDLGLCPAE